MSIPAPAPLTFVTGNPGKLREAGEILARPVRGVALELEELQTTELEPLVRHKAAEAFRRLGVPLIVEDTSLVFAAWGVLPGPFIKHFLAALGSAGLAAAAAATGDPAAEACCGVGYHDGWRIHYFEGRTAGTIVPPRGTGGFGWDPIFRPEGEERTFAEMTPAEKYAHSMRARALGRLAAMLDLTAAES
jgi:non-canonical purine NTP pyrophosphatase (RdgB/HAM1 family)